MSLDEKLRQRFGLQTFRPWQREVVEELLFGRGRVLLVAPTGGGKSLCYQFPATELSGTTVVVSPLIALMENQVRALRERGIEATWLASTVDGDELRRRGAALRAGRYALVYVAPERLAAPGLLETLGRLRPPLVAVDEAHCISQWGHDFRPDYLRLREVLDALRPPRVIACTATATPRVRQEILAELGLRPGDTSVVLRGFARPNLHLSVLELDGPSRRLRAAVAGVEEAVGAPRAPRGGAIVYAATRRAAEEAGAALADAGFRSGTYHAGLEAEARATVNDRFAAGEVDVVAATNAFGMGIDRPDIRAVIHLAAPGSIEAYYQEVGRAGRDGQPAHGLLIAGSSDFWLRRRFVEHAADGSARVDELVERGWSLFLDLMRYVEAGSCRHDFILSYFGDEQETLGGCGHCDVCERIDAGEGSAPGGGRSEEDAVVVRKALAGIARTKGRVGILAVAEMLAGAESDRLRRMGLTRLSTHGVLSGRPKPWVTALLRRLITAGLVEITAGQYPVPLLTSAGWDVMTARASARVLLPPEGAGEARRRTRKAEPSAAKAAELSLEEAETFERLRAARLDLARAQGVPAYVVCHDRTLREIAVRRPTSRSDLAEVHGMGPARLDAYGERFLEVVRAAAPQ
jgi:ATP-dependent DNA helicase RecQ